MTFRRLVLAAALAALPLAAQAQTGPWGVGMPFAAPEPVTTRPSNPYASPPPPPYAPPPRPSGSINEHCLFSLERPC